MNKTSILFLIHDLGQGGAEKVLVNLVNNMNRELFDITVIALFGGGVNEQFLGKDIHFRTVFKRMYPGNSKLMKILSPQTLHRMFVKDHYDVEISYLEGPSARIISGCTDTKTKLVSWIHVEQHTMQVLAQAFRSENEARACYEKFDQTVCVSNYVADDFRSLINIDRPCIVLYNTVESEKIKDQSRETANEIVDEACFKIIGVGSLREAKGFERLLKIVLRLNQEHVSTHLYILGKGPLRKNLEEYIKLNKMEEFATLLGYQTNPYKYVSKCDLFVCASYAEGFSTAATEALIVGTPVCTVNVSGMKEMLGEDNEYGVVVENNDEALYQGIKKLLIEPGRLNHYKHQAEIRGREFSTTETVRNVEKMLLQLKG